MNIFNQKNTEFMSASLLVLLTHFWKYAPSPEAIAGTSYFMQEFEQASKNHLSPSDRELILEGMMKLLCCQSKQELLELMEKTSPWQGGERKPVHPGEFHNAAYDLACEQFSKWEEQAALTL